MPALPARPSLEHLRKQAKAVRRSRGIPLAAAQHELARSYGFPSWPRLVHHVQAAALHGMERALVSADPQEPRRTAASGGGPRFSRPSSDAT